MLTDINLTFRFNFNESFNAISWCIGTLSKVKVSVSSEGNFDKKVRKCTWNSRKFSCRVWFRKPRNKENELEVLDKVRQFSYRLSKLFVVKLKIFSQILFFSGSLRVFELIINNQRVFEASKEPNGNNLSKSITSVVWEDWKTYS